MMAALAAATAARSFSYAAGTSVAAIFTAMVSRGWTVSTSNRVAWNRTLASVSVGLSAWRVALARLGEVRPLS